MVNHATMLKPDGNGFRGGIRLSWPAVMAVLATLAIATTIQLSERNGVDRRLTRIEDKIDHISERLTDHITDSAGAK